MKTFKPALNDTKKIRINAQISQYQDDFHDHLQLVEYFSELLPICSSRRCYKFYIWFISKQESVSDVIGSILQIEEVKRSQSVQIDCNSYKQTQNHQLPIGIISTWLNETPNLINQKQNDEKSLRIRPIGVRSGPGIDANFGYIQNAQELANHLHEVLFLYLANHLPIYNVHIKIFGSF